MSKFKLFIVQNYMLFVFLITFAGVVGSLIFSEFYHLDPCKLCWFQRIFMYPVAIQSAISILLKSTIRKIYILALTVPGMLVGGYQYFTQLTFGKSDVNLCGSGVSCSFIDFQFAGFITIPFMSFAAFLVINILLVLAYYWGKKKDVVAEVIEQ